MNGKALLKTLDEVKQGEHFDIWNLLPDIASGKEWKEEILDAVSAIKDQISEDEDYDLDDLRDAGHGYADNCASSSHKYIHDKNHALSLWASDEIEAEVEELSGEGHKSMTRLETLYYYTATRMVWDAVADQVFQNAEELEEESVSA